MHLDEFIRRLQALADHGHGNDRIFVGYNADPNGEGEEMFMEIGGATDGVGAFPKGVWLTEKPRE